MNAYSKDLRLRVLAAVDRGERREEIVSIATMSRAIRRLGWTYKQRLWVPPNATSRPEPAGASG